MQCMWQPVQWGNLVHDVDVLGVLMIGRAAWGCSAAASGRHAVEVARAGMLRQRGAVDTHKSWTLTIPIDAAPGCKSMTGTMMRREGLACETAQGLDVGGVPQGGSIVHRVQAGRLLFDAPGLKDAVHGSCFWRPQ